MRSFLCFFIILLFSAAAYGNATIPTCTATIPVGAGPANITVNPVNGFVYVTNYGSSTVSVIDGDTKDVIGEIPVGSLPFGIDVNPNSNSIYVSNIFDGTVSVIDGKTNQVISTIEVDDGPQYVGVNQSTNRIYVACYDSNTVSVIDGNTNTFVESIPVGVGPLGLKVNSTTNRVYVGNYGSDSISIIDGSAGVVVDTISIGRIPYAIGIDESRNRLFAGCIGDGLLYSVNAADNTVTPVFDRLSNYHGIFVDAASHLVYFTDYYANSLLVLDEETGALVDEIPVGSEPYGVAVDAYTNRIYTANASDSTVSIIEDVTPQQAVQLLIAAINNSDIMKGTKNSLSIRLQKAIGNLDAGKDAAAVRNLRDFITKVSSQSEKRINAYDAQQLTIKAQRICQALQ